MSKYQAGDPVVFKMSKASTHPGRRARSVDPAPRGELYTYSVDKFWVVAQVQADGQLLLKTRRGKEHLVAEGDARLRPARWWEKLLYHDRFPKLENVG